MLEYLTKNEVIAAVPGTKTFEVVSRVGDEVEAQVGMKLEMSETGPMIIGWEVGSQISAF
jgi:hypothetical protein